MILQSLCDYYDILTQDKKSKIPPVGYSNVKVSYALVLSVGGELKNIIPLFGEDNKKLDYMLVPEQPGRSGTNAPAYFLCDNSKYVLGFSKEKNKQVQLFDKQFQNFKTLNSNILENIKDEEAKAVLNYLKSWDVSKVEENLEKIYPNYEELSQENRLVFILEGKRNYIHQNETLKQAWEKYRLSKLEQKQGFCLITGTKELILKTHSKISGATKNPGSIVGFNEPSFESYGKKQSYNAPVGVESAFKYTTVLNHMLRSDSNQKIQIGDATTVFWAEFDNQSDSSEQFCYNLVQFGLNANIKSDDKKTEPEKLQDYETEKTIKICFEALNEGRKLSDIDRKIQDDARFYILGLSPNNARISVRFFHRDTFGNFMKNLAQHHKDMELEGGRFLYIPPRVILNETTVKNSSKDKPAPLLSGRLMQSIITGSEYPDDLYLAMISRIRAEQDINHTRVSVIKAYLTRKKKEVLPVLDETNTNTAYRLGRLFALLERAQENAQGDINSTIKDRYFSTASATSATVFPTLMKLNNHHLAKLEGKGKWLEIEIGKVLEEVHAFPVHLNMEDQGLFILGYYHQRQSFFKKKETAAV